MAKLAVSAEQTIVLLGDAGGRQSTLVFPSLPVLEVDLVPVILWLAHAVSPS